MKKAAAAGLLLVLAACSKEGPPPLDIAQSKQMIWDAIKDYHDSGDKGDIDKIGTLLAPEVSLVLSHEDVIRGHDSVLRALRDRMKTYEGQSRSTITGKEVISITGDMALVTYVASVGTQRGIITAVCRRNKDGKWLISHIHDTWSLPASKK
jgi:ketosteroid isomerase-like protein